MPLNEDRTTWNKCALCGKVVHPWQEASSEPLADGIACVSCQISRVYATRCNNGIPSHRTCRKNQHTGKWETVIIPDKIIVREIKEEVKEDD